MRTDLPGDALTADALTDFSQVVGMIYDAALAPEAWPAVLREMADWMSAPQATLFTPVQTFDQGGFMHSHGLDAQAMLLWTTRYHGMDLWAQRAQAKGVMFSGQVVSDQELATEPELLATPMYQEFFAPRDIGRVASGLVFGVDRAEFPAVACSFNRPLRRPFDAPDLYRLRLLLPHLSRALGLMFRLRAADFKLACSLAALETLPQAVLLLGPQGQVSHANAAARAILEQRDGLSLALQPGLGEQLRAASRGDQQRLETALQSALQVPLLQAPMFAESLAISRPSGQPALVLSLSALPPRNEFSHGGVAVGAIAFIQTERPLVEDPMRAEIFRLRYALTATELRVVLRAVQGDTVEAAALALDISDNTVKTHLKRAYAKTGVGNRAELVRVWLAAAAPPPPC